MKGHMLHGQRRRGGQHREDSEHHTNTTTRPDAPTPQRQGRYACCETVCPAEGSASHGDVALSALRHFAGVRGWQLRDDVLEGARGALPQQAAQSRVDQALREAVACRRAEVDMRRDCVIWQVRMHDLEGGEPEHLQHVRWSTRLVWWAGYGRAAGSGCRGRAGGGVDLREAAELRVLGAGAGEGGWVWCVGYVGGCPVGFYRCC